jgi:hypothetical protein
MGGGEDSTTSPREDLPCFPGSQGGEWGGRERAGGGGDREGDGAEGRGGGVED